MGKGTRGICAFKEKEGGKKGKKKEKNGKENRMKIDVKIL